MSVDTGSTAADHLADTDKKNEPVNSSTSSALSTDGALGTKKDENEAVASSTSIVTTGSAGIIPKDDVTVVANTALSKEETVPQQQQETAPVVVKPVPNPSARSTPAPTTSASSSVAQTPPKVNVTPPVPIKSKIDMMCQTDEDEVTIVDVIEKSVGTDNNTKAPASAVKIPEPVTVSSVFPRSPIVPKPPVQGAAPPPVSKPQTNIADSTSFFLDSFVQVIKVPMDVMKFMMVFDENTNSVLINFSQLKLFGQHIAKNEKLQRVSYHTWRTNKDIKMLNLAVPSDAHKYNLLIESFDKKDGVKENARLLKKYLGRTYPLRKQEEERMMSGVPAKIQSPERELSKRVAPTPAKGLNTPTKKARIDGNVKATPAVITLPATPKRANNGPPNYFGQSDTTNDKDGIGKRKLTEDENRQVAKNGQMLGANEISQISMMPRKKRNRGRGRNSNVRMGGLSAATKANQQAFTTPRAESSYAKLAEVRNLTPWSASPTSMTANWKSTTTPNLPWTTDPMPSDTMLPIYQRRTEVEHSEYGYGQSSTVSNFGSRHNQQNSLNVSSGGGGYHQAQTSQNEQNNWWNGNNTSNNDSNYANGNNSSNANNYGSSSGFAGTGDHTDTRRLKAESSWSSSSLTATGFGGGTGAGWTGGSGASSAQRRESEQPRPLMDSYAANRTFWESEIEPPSSLRYANNMDSYNSFDYHQPPRVITPSTGHLQLGAPFEEFAQNYQREEVRYGLGPNKGNNKSNKRGKKKSGKSGYPKR